MQSYPYDKIGYSLIQSFVCNKLSGQSTGQLHYQLWQNNEEHYFAWSLSHNDAAGGFSRELIDMSAIIELLTELKQAGLPFHATALRPLFVGKSANNASFFAALLVDQKVLQFHSHTTRLLEVTADYLQWPMSLEDRIQVKELDDAIHQV